MSQDNGTYFPPRCVRCLMEVSTGDVVTYQGKTHCPSCARKTLDEAAEQQAAIKDLQAQHRQLLVGWSETADKLVVITHRGAQLQRDLDECNREAEALAEEYQYLANKLDEVRHKLDKLGVVTPATLPSLSASGGARTAITSAELPPGSYTPTEGAKP